MGLAVVHGIVKSHGGAITVESEIGQGTTFDIYLPTIGNTDKEENTLTDTFPAGTENIINVDDEPALARIGKQMLERLGYRVTTRRNSLDALSDFISEPYRFDLVITDMTMPHLTGLELARKLLKIRPQLPIILCTGYSERVSDQQAEATGIRAFLMKPLQLQELAQKIRQVLDQS
jgi:CheY-like chemotaxis protein